MPSYAIVLAGVPARVIDGVMPVLKADFASSHIFLSDRARDYGDQRARYNQEAVDKVVAACAEALYGKTARPFSFCRRPGTHCAIRKAVKGSAQCGKTDEHTCGLEKPDRLIVLYQPSHDDGPLLKALKFTAVAQKLPVSCYGHLKTTINAVKQSLQSAKDLIDQADASIRRGPSTPLLLPLRNFFPSAVLTLLRKFSSREDHVSLERRFRQQFWRESEKAYEANGLMFSPTIGPLAHGDLGAAETTIQSLTGHYRLGASFEPGFHYDVGVRPPTKLKGFEFECSEKGPVTCQAKNTYVNIYPNDVVRLGT